MARIIFSLLLLVIFALPGLAQSVAKDFAQAEAAWEREDYKSAETHFDRALRASKGNADAESIGFYGRGVARLQLHKWSGAKDDLTRAIELDPKNADAFSSRAMARKGLGDYDGLLDDAHEAARLNPTEYASFEDDAKSTALYRRVLQLFVGLAGILLVAGGYALVRVLIRITRAEREANRVAG
ncbi:hypothetical protein EON83_03210 [bacterium]|nr:MAG: hypothetical protein EON83_03210 [bacterium]